MFERLRIQEHDSSGAPIKHQKIRAPLFQEVGVGFRPRSKHRGRKYCQNIASDCTEYQNVQAVSSTSKNGMNLT